MALAADRVTPKVGAHPVDEYVDLPVEAATNIFRGAQVAVNAAGNAVPASADPTLRVVGSARVRADNSGGIAGAISVRALRGAFTWVNGGATLLTGADRFENCFAFDDDTVTSTDEGGTLPLAGRFLGFDADTNPIVESPTFNPLDGLEALASGEYVAVLTDVLNIAPSVLVAARFVRVGNQVTVYFAVTIDAVVPGAAELGISLPVVSILAAVGDLTGSASSATVGENAAAIAADVANNRASMTFIAVSIAVEPWEGSFSYIVQ